MIPIRLGEDWDFTTLRLLLLDSGFTDSAIATRFNAASIEEFFEKDSDAEQIDAYQDSALGVLTRLFVEGRYASHKAARTQLGSTAVQALERLGLIKRQADDPGNIEANVSLYETADVFLISDRWNTPSRTPFVVHSDVVYPALVSNSRRFLEFLPTSMCDDFLDMCAGTGVAALSAAKQFASRSYAFDVAERCVAFAEFNKRLNALENVSVRGGDLYQPANGVAYDRIVAHPPYVPVLRPKYVYHDGGQDGESIVRRLIQGLPDHLKPGGVYYMLAMGSDRRDNTFENRIREWLGERESEFDVLLCPKKLTSPEDFGMSTSMRSQTPREDFAEFKELFRKLEVDQLVYGFVFIQRHEQVRPSFTARRQFGPRTTPKEFHWALQWETMLTQPAASERILAARPRRNPETVWLTSQNVTEQGWSDARHKLVGAYPFSMEATTDAWSPFLVGLCDGSKTVREHFDELKEQGVLPEAGDPNEFAFAVASLVSGGFIFLE